MDPTTPTPAAQQAVRTYQQVQAMADERHGRDDRAEAAAWAAGLTAATALVLALLHGWPL